MPVAVRPAVSAAFLDQEPLAPAIVLGAVVNASLYDLPVDFVLYIEDVTDAANQVGRARLVTLEYSWKAAGPTSTRRFTRTLTAIRSEVPTF